MSFSRNQSNKPFSSVVFPVPTSPVNKMKPLRLSIPYVRADNASWAAGVQYKYRGSGLKLKGSSLSPKKFLYIVGLARRPRDHCLRRLRNSRLEIIVAVLRHLQKGNHGQCRQLEYALHVAFRAKGGILRFQGKHNCKAKRQTAHKSPETKSFPIRVSWPLRQAGWI